MNSRISRLSVFTILIQLMPAAAVLVAAPLGTAFTYQGQLKEGGAPASGFYDFRFTLFSPDVPTAIPPVCVVNVEVINGLFTVDVEFPSSAFDGKSLAMHVDVKPHTPIVDCVSNTLPDPFTRLVPPQPITPTPYAIHALSAPNGHALDAADGLPTDVVFVNNAGNVGIGTTVPSNRLSVVGSADFTIGSVGIGTTTPASTLHVSRGPAGIVPPANTSLTLEDDTSHFLRLLAPDANSSGIAFGNPTNGTAAAGIVFNSDVANGLAFRTGTNDTRMVISSAGDVGIGTNSPAARLDVAGIIRSDDLNLHSAGGATTVQMIGEETGGGSTLLMNNSAGVQTVRLDAHDGEAAGALVLDNAAGTATVVLDGQDGVAPAGGKISVRNSTGRETVEIDADEAGAGFMRLENATNTTTILLDGAGTGNAAVRLPADSISAQENLEEPGIAADARTGSVTLTPPPGTIVVLSRTITVPADGFVLAQVIAHVQPGIIVGDATPSLSIHKTTAPTSSTDGFGVKLGSSENGHISLHGLFSVSAGANTFEVRGLSFVNNCNISSRRLTLMFFPTTYGTTDVED